MKQRIVIALGGNAVQKQNEGGTYEEQAKNIEEAMRNLLPLAQDDNCELIITHGNGPQVGNILLQNAAAAQIVPPVPMFVCGAMSQGQIGYLLQQSLTNLLKQSGIQREVVTVITQVAVDKNDAAFQSPSKPVGPFYNSEDAKKSVAKRDARSKKTRTGVTDELCHRQNQLPSKKSKPLRR